MLGLDPNRLSPYCGFCDKHFQPQGIFPRYDTSSHNHIGSGRLLVVKVVRIFPYVLHAALREEGARSGTRTNENGRQLWHGKSISK